MELNEVVRRECGTEYNQAVRHAPSAPVRRGHLPRKRLQCGHISLMLPLRHEVRERAGPIAKQWEGEVVIVSKTLRVTKEKNPDTSPSPRKRGSPPSPHAYDARGEGLRRDV